MSDYEIFYNATDDMEVGWYWRGRCGRADGRMGWMEFGPFDTIDEARADAEWHFADDED